MAIVGQHPESGVRLTVERPRAGGPPWHYAGEAVTEGARFRLTAVVSADGEVAVDVVPAAPAEVADRLRLILRTAWKHAQRDGTAPPLRMARWRAE